MQKNFKMINRREVIKMQYLYGALGNRLIIGKIHDDNPNIIIDPAFIDHIAQPFINPLTQQPDPTKLNIMIQCVAMPVTWIFKAPVIPLSAPDESDAAVRTYRSSMGETIKKLKPTQR